MAVEDDIQKGEPEPEQKPTDVPMPPEPGDGTESGDAPPQHDDEAQPDVSIEPELFSEPQAEHPEEPNIVQDDSVADDDVVARLLEENPPPSLDEMEAMEPEAAGEFTDDLNDASEPYPEEPIPPPKLLEKHGKMTYCGPFQRYTEWYNPAWMDLYLSTYAWSDHNLGIAVLRAGELTGLSINVWGGTPPLSMDFRAYNITQDLGGLVIASITVGDGYDASSQISVALGAGIAVAAGDQIRIQARCHNVGNSPSATKQLSTSVTLEVTLIL